MKRDDLFRLTALVLLGVLIFLSALRAPGGLAATSAVGDPLPRIQCPAGYTATIYAEGLSAPDGLAFSPDGILYVAEETAGRVSRIETYGSVTPVLDGLQNPEGIAFDDSGALYVVEDVQNGRVIKMATDGMTTTLAANLDAPEGVVWAPDGTLYVTESNVEFASDPPFDYRTHVSAIPSGGGVTRILTDTVWWSYAGITIGPDGDLYVTNEASGTGTDDSVFVVDPLTGTRTLLVSGLVSPEGLRFSPAGGFPLYVVEEDTGGDSGRLNRVEADGSHTPLCTGFFNVEDVALDADGRLYVSEDTSGTIIRIDAGPPDRAHPRAIILFIGDGMGEAHRTAGRWSAVGQNVALAMDKVPFGGWARTASADDPVTDSAAAATALATGIKTNNGVIGMDPGLNPLTTILERAQARGMAVGLVTDVQISHATPAAFAAHVPDREMMTEIARQMLETEVDVLLGGGEDEFLPNTTSGQYPEPGERTDGRNLIDEAVAAGYAYVYTAADLSAVVPTSTTRLLGLFADELMPRPYSPSLAEMTQKAIAVLSQDPDGFFLMVEGGQIDKAAHDNDAANVISDTIGLDGAIAVAQAYAEIQGNTLIIVTADHETGGMSVSLSPGGDGPFWMPGGRPFYVNWTTGQHTAADVPTTAQGPWSDLLIGNYENTYIHDVMRMALESSPGITLTQIATPPAGSTVQLDDNITYTLTLTNNGTADASGLALTHTLSAGASYLSGSTSASAGLSVAATPPPALVLTGTLPVGQALTVTFGVSVSSVPPDAVLINKAEAVADGADWVTSTLTHSVAFTPGLQITKTVTPSSGGFVAPGDRITYTVAVVNHGDPVTDLVLSDTLDLANVTLVVSHTTRGLLSGPNPVRVAGLDLGSDQGLTLTLEMMVTGVVSGTVIRNQASLTSTQTPSPQFSAEVTHVISHTAVFSPSFTLFKRADPPGGTPLASGDTLTYIVTAINNGDPASNVVLSDAIPAETTYVPDSAVANLGDVVFDGAQLQVSVPELANGSALTVTFRVTVTASVITTISNTAWLVSDQTTVQRSDPVSHLVGPSEWHNVYLPVLLKDSVGVLDH